MLKIITLLLEVSLDVCLLRQKLLIHLNLALFHELSLHVPSLLVALELQLVELLLVLKLYALPRLLFHILQDDLTLQLSLAHLILGLNG